MIEQLYNDLLTLFEDYPNATRQQYINGVVNLGHATAGEAAAFADAFVAAAIDMMILPTNTDFDDMMERVRSVSLEQAIRAARNIFEVVRTSPVFLLAQLNEQLVAVDAQIIETNDLRVGGLQGKTYIQGNFPESELRDKTIEVLDMGIRQLQGSLDSLNQYRQRLLNDIASLGG